MHCNATPSKREPSRLFRNLPLENTQINLVFCSLIRNFLLWRSYFRSKEQRKTSFPLVLCSLIRNFAPVFKYSTRERVKNNNHKHGKESIKTFLYAGSHAAAHRPRRGGDSPLVCLIPSLKSKKVTDNLFF